MLEIKDLHAGVNGNEIVNGISLSINKGEIHAIMGPNGSGKSTLAKILSGHPAYETTGGTVTLKVKIFWKWTQKKDLFLESLWGSNIR